MRFLVLAILVSILYSCGSDGVRVVNPVAEINIPLERMEQELSFRGLELAQLKSENKRLLEKYSECYAVFVKEFIRQGDARDPMIGNHLSLHDKSGGFEFFEEINESLINEFRDFDSHLNAIENAFAVYSAIYPDSVLPKRIVTMNSYFNAQAFVTSDNDLCIGLDMFLGAGNEHAKKLPREVFPEFLIERMKRDYLEVNAMQAWLLEKCYREVGSDFLDEIVSSGKILYLLQLHFPDKNERDVVQYTKEEMNWCLENEQNVWQQLVDEQLLYSKDPVLVDNWIKDGPFTKGLPAGSPSRVGRWLGLQMVKDYMAENPDVTIPQMVEEVNSKRILKHYKKGK